MSTSPLATHLLFMLSSLGSRPSEIALDLGSARTRALVPGRKRVIDQPTVSLTGSGIRYPVQRGTVIDTLETANLLNRLLNNRPRFEAPSVVLTTPNDAHNTGLAEVRTAVEVLQPRVVLSVPVAQAVAYAEKADTHNPLLVVDFGAHLTEVALFSAGTIVASLTVPLGTIDMGQGSSVPQLAENVAGSIRYLLESEHAAQTRQALRRGPLLAGGGALRPEIPLTLTASLHSPTTTAAQPHNAATRGAAKLLRDARTTLRNLPATEAPT